MRCSDQGNEQIGQLTALWRHTSTGDVSDLITCCRAQNVLERTGDRSLLRKQIERKRKGTSGRMWTDYSTFEICFGWYSLFLNEEYFNVDPGESWSWILWIVWTLTWSGLFLWLDWTKWYWHITLDEVWWRATQDNGSRSTKQNP